MPSGSVAELRKQHDDGSQDDGSAAATEVEPSSYLVQGCCQTLTSDDVNQPIDLKLL
jgi:hypothetical protein